MNAKNILLAWMQRPAANLYRLSALFLIATLLLLTACDSLSGLEEEATTDDHPSWDDSLWSTAPVTTVPTIVASRKPRASSPPATQKPSVESDDVTVWNAWHGSYLDFFPPHLPLPPSPLPARAPKALPPGHEASLSNPYTRPFATTDFTNR